MQARQDKPCDEVVCVGDLHGNLTKVKRLWQNLVIEMGPQRLAKATVIFLGDFCTTG